MGCEDAVTTPRGYRPPGQAACSRVPSAAASCCTPPATFRLPPGPPSTSRRCLLPAFLPQLWVKALAVVVLARASRLDVQRPIANFATPSLQLATTPDHCPSECFPVFLGTASRPQVLRSLHTSQAFLRTRIARHSRANTSISVSIRSTLPYVRDARHDSRTRSWLLAWSHPHARDPRSATTGGASVLCGVPAPHDARCAAPDPCLPASQHFATAP